ncbi:MAG: hypothetical protein FJW40_05270 [Acidobacteria bacterium]|nr:hypothetical protein [Acidobacteriota bacterium]
MARRLLVCFLAALMAWAAPARKPRAAAKPAGPSSDVRALLRKMTLHQRIAQLVMIPFHGETPHPRSRQAREFVQLVRDTGVGGLILLNRVSNGTVQNAEPHAVAAFLNRMQRLAKIPLIAGADFERGASMRVSGTVRHPHLMAFGAVNDLKFTRALGAATARESRALGIHWIFAPSADVNNNPDNPIINIRSFGEDPEAVSSHVRAFIEGAHENPGSPVLVSAKHFPGHGDTNVDTHLGMATIAGGRDRLDRVELAPFRAAIAARADSVMTSHVTVPALDPDPVPATISPRILGRVLREELGFRGLIITDAMDMQALTRQFPGGEAAVRAIEAGADLLLMPPRPAAAVDAVAAAVKSGRLSAKRIDESAIRVLAAKARVGLFRRKLVDTDQLSDVLDDPDEVTFAEQVAARALTLLRNEGSVVPLRDAPRACLFTLAESRHSQLGRTLIDELKARVPALRSTWLDASMPEAGLMRMAAESATCSAVAVAAFVAPSANGGDGTLRGAYHPFVQALLAGRAPVIFIAMGNPYLLRIVPNAAALMATFSTVPPAELAVARALAGEIAIQGRTPVSIPGVAALGAGLASVIR